MKIVNLLPEFLACLRRWDVKPSFEQVEHEYLAPIQTWLAPMVEDFSHRGFGFASALDGLEWDLYRTRTLELDSVFEEKRALHWIEEVERLTGKKLGGEIILFSTFTLMDGYARFHQGNHRVFLGVEENHGRGKYLDVLVSHELTHVAREGTASVWEGFGLSPKMTHDEFTENLPVIEHLMNEGFACVVSELLNPGLESHLYAYQTADSIKHVWEHAPAMDREIRLELNKGSDGDYGTLYDPSRFSADMPRFCHYVWAWKWARAVLKEVCGGDPKKLVGLCSKDLVDHALKFKLAEH